MTTVLHMLDDILSAPTADALSVRFESAVGKLGGDGFSIVTFPENGRVFRKDLTRELQPWVDYYGDSDLLATCPIAQTIMASVVPFTIDQVEKAASERGADMRVFSAGRAHGVHHGLNVPVRTRTGQHGCIFIRHEASELPPAEFADAVLLALAAHRRLDHLISDPSRGDVLSAREREVLTWFANGKSAHDVALLMSIAPATVMFHYRKVADRYGTLSRAHTIVEAIRRGVLQI